MRPQVLSPFLGVEIAYLIDPDRAMMAGVFILLVGPTKSDRLKGRGQTK